ncbi:MAG: NAD-dependent deacylase [Chloroflexi bacterium]|nr:NAD-dependent deacylase [Chloroflexota bacterium]
MTNIDEQLETAARIVSESSYLIALVGAGMSKESGIPTFRGGDGLWDKHGEPPMDGYQRMLADPAAWWAERQAQRQSQAGDELTRAIEEAKPNPGHIALAEMERRGYLKHIITQNIDNLHQEAGSEAITEIHGNRTKMRCVNCVRRWGRDEFVPKDMPPRCPDCEGLVKSDTVMFGEPIPPDALESCFREAQRADAVLLLGTSAAVYPAAEFPVIVYRNGGKLIEVNPQETPLSELCSAVLRAPSGHVLPALLEEVGKLDTGS